MLMVNQLIGFGASADPYTKLLLHCDGTNGSTSFPDASTAAHAITANGNAAVSTAQSMFGGASAVFDGNGDYLSSASNTDWQFAGDLTIDLWARFNAITTSSFTNSAFANGIITTNFGNEVVDGVNFGVASPTTGWDCRVGSVNLSPTGIPTTGVWYHLALVRFGTTATFYVNGTSAGSSTIAGTVVNGELRVGHRHSTANTGFYLNGWVDEVRISQVARWTSNFTPPVSAYS